MIHKGTLLVATKEKGQRRSKQKKETETSESSDTLRREGLSEQRRGIGEAQKSRWHKVLATVPLPSMQQKCTKGLSYRRGLKCEENKKSTVRALKLVT